MLDWLSLIGQKEEAFSYVKELLEQGHACVRFLPNAVHEKELWRFYWEQRSAQRLKGQQLLYFQYPFFRQRTEEGEVFQPLLRWPSQLEPPVKGSSYWTLNIQGLAKTDISYVLITEAAYNKKWCSWANEQFEHDWNLKLESCLQTGGQGMKSLSNVAQSMMEKTNWLATTVHPELRSLHSYGNDESQENTADLLWMASVGLCNEQWEHVTDESSINWQTQKEEEDSFLDQLNLLKLDPYQYQVLREGNSCRFLTVSGKQSTGKTHTIIEGVKANLLSGKPCLIVARGKASLINIQKKLEKAQLGDLAFHWHNEATDLAVFQAKIQTSSKLSASISSKELTEWLAALGRQHRIRRSLGELHKASRKAVIEGISWAELLGAYLREARVEGKELLASQLSAAHFKFSVEEYKEIESAINKTKPLYLALGNIHHPLSNLNAAIFVHQDLDESKVFIQETSKKFLETAKLLHQNYIRGQSQYADQLATHFESYYIKLREQLQQVLALLEDGQNEFGADTLASGEMTLKLYGRFSKRFKKAGKHRLKILDSYEKLQLLHDKMNAFNFDWSVGKAKNILPDLMPTLAKYQVALQNWRETFASKINEELIRLNHKTALDSLKVSARILPLEQDMEIFIDEVNASGLYQLPLHSKMLTLSRQQKYLEDIIGQLERSRSGLLDYNTFYVWQRNWFSLTETTRKTIQALLRSLPEDWTAAFSSWYLNECLSQSYNPFPIVSETAIADYPEQINKLRSRLSDVIRHHWILKHNSALTKLKNIVKNKSITTNKMLDEGGHYLNSVYPIALASPEMARLLSPYYKVVYLENAQSLSASSVMPIAEYCEQMIAFVNKEQEAFEEKGIVGFLKKQGAKSIRLRNAYKFNFAQQALELRGNIVFHALEGRFNEEDQSNEVEAFGVLKILNSIKKTPQQTYPSVGIVCMTKGQRNKILELLYRIKKDRHTGVEIIQHLERNGLRVITAEEMIGQHFDHVIFSAVHAPIDIKGHLSPMLSTLNRGKQMATLIAFEALIGSNIKCDVLSSLPQEELKIRTTWSDKKGEQYFGQFLELMSSIAKGDDDRSFLLSKFWKDEAITDENRKLGIELKYRLSEQLSDWNFELSKSEDAEFSYLEVTSPEGTKIALLADGFMADSPYTTIEWENEQQQHLGLAGYQILSFSTESLWKTPDYYCGKLINQLEKMNNSLEEE